MIKIDEGRSWFSPGNEFIEDLENRNLVYTKIYENLLAFESPLSHSEARTFDIYRYRDEKGKPWLVFHGGYEVPASWVEEVYYAEDVKKEYTKEELIEAIRLFILRGIA